MNSLPIEDRLALLEDQVSLILRIVANRGDGQFHDAMVKAISTTPPPDAQLLGFTKKQHATLQLLALGRSNQEIADVLQVSESTAKVHVRAIMKKLNIDNRLDVASYFREMVSKWTADDYQRVAGIEKDWAINPDRYENTTLLLRETK